MERTISQEERIKRAEEIYSRRRQMNRSDYVYNPRPRAEKNKANSVKQSLIRKMIIQVLVCTAIYLGVYTIQHSNQIFPQEVLNKTKEILMYDVSFQTLCDKVNEYINKIQPTNKDEVDNTEETVNNVEENIVAEEATPEAVGGAEEVAVSPEKTQEELDVEYVKQNLNIIWPLKGTITSKFGTRTPTEIVTANHYGLDIGGNTGTDIICAMDGTVTLSSSEGDYGKHIRVENGEVTTLYAHCSKLLVKEGENVKQGQKIAEVGQTGRATGPHLHFEIKRENRFINPEEILGAM